MNDQSGKFSKQALGLTVGLAAQFMLGILVVIYAKFPESGDAGVMWKYANGQPLIMAHAAWGTLLFLGSVAFAIRSRKAKNTTWTRSAILSLLAVLGAWISGERFVSTQKDVFSLSMAVFFILAMLSYVWGIYRSKSV